MNVLLALLALAACSSAKSLWVVNPYSPAFSPSNLPVVPTTCRESFQKIETKFCEPTFEIVCERFKQPSQTIDLKRECVDVPSVVCGSHKHNHDDQGGNSVDVLEFGGFLAVPFGRFFEPAVFTYKNPFVVFFGQSLN